MVERSVSKGVCIRMSVEMFKEVHRLEGRVEIIHMVVRRVKRVHMYTCRKG